MKAEVLSSRFAPVAGLLLAASRLPAMVARAFIRAYQITLSPFIGNQCRFHPSCSHYALEAIDAHGAAKGCWLALKRLGRCHPFNPGGFDPVPAKNPQTAGEIRNRQASGACPQPKEN